MDQTMFLFWLGAAVVLAIVEAATASLVTIWFAGGAVLAMICAWLGIGYTGQLAVFVIGSLALLILTRPFAKRVLHRDGQPTNADRIIGQQGIVTEQIDKTKGTGRITVLGQSWSAVSADESILEPETAVTVKAIEGVKAVVERRENV